MLGARPGWDDAGVRGAAVRGDHGWRVRLLCLTGLGLAAAAAWTARTPGTLLVAADLAVGLLLIALGAAGSGPGRPATRLAAGGVAWLLGSLASPLLYLHRAVLLHAILTAPAGRLGRSRATSGRRSPSRWRSSWQRRGSVGCGRPRWRWRRRSGSAPPGAWPGWTSAPCCWRTTR
jgi:hypothetical protein